MELIKFFFSCTFLFRCSLLLCEQSTCITAFGGLVNHQIHRSPLSSLFKSNEREIIRSSRCIPSSSNIINACRHDHSKMRARQTIFFSTAEEKETENRSNKRVRDAMNTFDSGETAATSTAIIIEDDDEAVQGVICARGVCVIAEEESSELCVLTDDDESTNQIICEPKEPSIEPGLTVAYLWPRALLLICSVLYGTNFPLGRLMNDSLPASSATSTRMLLASIALSPFLFQLKPKLRNTALLCGTFTAMGYISQSIALVDTPAGRSIPMALFDILSFPFCTLQFSPLFTFKPLFLFWER